MQSTHGRLKIDLGYSTNMRVPYSVGAEQQQLVQQLVQQLLQYRLPGLCDHTEPHSSISTRA